MDADNPHLSLYAEIQSIARKVHGRCNGAKSADLKGFGKRDVSLGPVIAIAEVQYWSDGLAARGVEMLLHYHRQIPEDIARLRELENVFPDTKAPVKVAPVIGLHEGKLALLTGYYDGSKEDAARLKKVMKSIGFGSCDKERIRHLENDPIDPVNYDEPLVALETAGWCILPEAKGAFGSYLARLRDNSVAAKYRIQQEAEDEARRATETFHSQARTSIINPYSATNVRRPASAIAKGRIREQEWVREYDTVPALWIELNDRESLSSLQELFQNRICRDTIGTKWGYLPHPTPEDKAAAKAFADARGWTTKFQ